MDTATETGDDPAAILAGIRERGYRNGATGAECARLSDAAAEDIPPLAAALERVLELHYRVERRKGWNLVCSYDNRRWPCPEVQAITRELTGKESSDD